MPDRVTLPLLLVMKVFVRRPGERVYGYGISKHTGLAPGTVQAILARLETEGVLTVRWEKVNPRKEGRPPRRYYRATSSGRKIMENLLQEGDQRLRSLL